VDDPALQAHLLLLLREADRVDVGMRLVQSHHVVHGVSLIPVEHRAPGHEEDTAEQGDEPVATERLVQSGHGYGCGCPGSLMFTICGAQAVQYMWYVNSSNS